MNGDGNFGAWDWGWFGGFCAGGDVAARLGVCQLGWIGGLGMARYREDVDLYVNAC